ncbi:acetyltransferase [Nitratidesulfovibrio vulgaris]|uniref:UDP-3-O-(3-hydroxymyristoyl)-like protein n=1 Tax=Nitratidesulfovibrio vulgaris (strain DP4) TaxID=391774 RepID=A0A0H3ABB3_NITV4|nr:acetyltransferase [Nitratidesulfovibrio vulgaris]ABM29607.1 UDP-3-O-(3-hydroxymyristoyl)-like protein [Nitratidesulfovibrio vulgaris DP4]
MDVVIIGTGGLAREFCTWFEDSITICGFSTKNTDEFSKFNLPGHLLPPDMTPEMAGTSNAVIAVGAPAMKETLYHFYTQRGFKFPRLVHTTSLVGKRVSLQEGCVVAPKVIIGPNTTLGRCTYINFGTTIAHDVKIDDFCQINPASCINGSISIGKRCTIGSHTSILQGVSVSNDVVTAVGSVIFSNVRSSGTMIGNPAKKMLLSVSGTIEKNSPPNA